MAGLATAPRLVQIFFALLIIGVLPLIIGFATAYWSHDDFAHTGLWMMCYRGYACSKTTFTKSYFEATQVLETIGLVLALIGLLLVTLYIFTGQTSGSRAIYILGMVFVLLAAGSIILGVIVYGSKSTLPLSWSYFLAVIGGVLYCVAGILMVIRILRTY